METLIVILYVISVVIAWGIIMRAMLTGWNIGRGKPDAEDKAMYGMLSFLAACVWPIALLGRVVYKVAVRETDD